METAIQNPGLDLDDEEDTLSSSIGEMPSAVLHEKIIRTFQAVGDNGRTYRALVLDAKRRMSNGEKVGGCDTWTAYQRQHLKRLDETLDTCMRRIRRLLEGDNPHEKYRHKPKKQTPDPGFDGRGDKSCDRTDEEYVKTCVKLIERTLQPLESDPKRFAKVADAILAEISDLVAEIPDRE